MHRKKLLDALETYQPANGAESDSYHRIIAFIKDTPACFERSHQAGHVTGSALLMNRETGCFLLNHHGTLNKWLSFGGHADGDGDLEAVAARETQEESGIPAFINLLPGILDVDIHAIPENKRKNEPEHFHYDISYLFDTHLNDYIVSDESIDLKWFSYEDAMALPPDTRLERMLHKARVFLRT